MSGLVRIDTNLLVLLVVGLVCPEAIGSHKRVKEYLKEDLLVLDEAIKGRRLCITPNVATETHNLLRQHADPQKSLLLERLGIILLDSIDNYVPNRIAVESLVYEHLGISDAALYVTRAPELLTADFGLYLAALRDGQEAKLFSHLRIAAGTIGAY